MMWFSFICVKFARKQTQFFNYDYEKNAICPAVGCMHINGPSQ